MSKIVFVVVLVLMILEVDMNMFVVFVCEGVENLHEDLLNYLYVKEFYDFAQIKCINMNVNFCVCAF